MRIEQKRIPKISLFLFIKKSVLILKARIKILDMCECHETADRISAYES